MIHQISRMLSSVRAGALPGRDGPRRARGGRPASGQCTLSNGPTGSSRAPPGRPASRRATPTTRSRSRRDPPLRERELRLRIYDTSVNAVAPPNLGWVQPGHPARLPLRRRAERRGVLRGLARRQPAAVSLSGAASCHGNTLVFVRGPASTRSRETLSAKASPRAADRGPVHRLRAAALLVRRQSQRGGHHESARLRVDARLASPSMGNINSEQNASFPGGGRFMLADNYLFYLSGSSIRVIDAALRARPGASRRDSAPSTFRSRRGGGARARRSALSAPQSTRPRPRRIYIAAEFRNSSSNSTGFTLLKLEGGRLRSSHLPPPGPIRPRLVPGDGLSCRRTPPRGTSTS